MNPAGHAFEYVALFAALTGIYLFACGFRLLERKRQFLNIPSSRIGSAEPGLVELHGSSEGPHTMHSPVSAKQCFYYRTIACRQNPSQGQWEQVAEESFFVPFFLEDETGRVLVDLRGAKIDLLRDFHEEYGKALLYTKTDIPENVASFLERHNIPTGSAVRIEETVITPRCPLFVTGTLASNTSLRVTQEPISTVAHPKRISPPPIVKGGVAKSEVPEPHAVSASEIVRLSPEPSEPVTARQMTMQGRVAAALMRAGQMPLVWNAPSSENAAGGAIVAEPPVTQPVPPTVLRRGEDPTFLISWRSRDGAGLGLDWQPVTLVLAGPLVTLAGIYWLMVLLGWR